MNIHTTLPLLTTAQVGIEPPIVEYLVRVDFGTKIGADLIATECKSELEVAQLIMSGEWDRPLEVIELIIAERSARPVTDTVAKLVFDKIDMNELSRSMREFLESNIGIREVAEAIREDA